MRMVFLAIEKTEAYNVEQYILIGRRGENCGWKTGTDGKQLCWI